MEDVNDISYSIISAAMEVHKVLGPGLLESAYEQCMAKEFSLRDIHFERQCPLFVNYKGIDLDDGKNSTHSILTLYRSDKDHPMGQKSIEIAFEMNKNNHRLGWLIFQLDLYRLKTDHATDVSGLKDIRF